MSLPPKTAAKLGRQQLLRSQQLGKARGLLSAISTPPKSVEERGFDPRLFVRQLLTKFAAHVCLLAKIVTPPKRISSRCPVLPVA